MTDTSDKDTTNKDTTIQLAGKKLSPGMGSGKVFLHRDILDRLDEFYDIEDLEVEGELQRFTLAVEKVSGDLKALASQVSNEMDEDLSNVFLAHIAILQDPSLKEEEDIHDINKWWMSSVAAIKPIHASVPFASSRDEWLYSAMSLVEAVRGGKPRELAIARDLLTDLIKGKK